METEKLLELAEVQSERITNANGRIDLLNERVDAIPNVLEMRKEQDENYQLLSKRLDELNERLSKHIEAVNTGFLSLQETQASFESHLKALHQ